MGPYGAGWLASYLPAPDDVDDVVDGDGARALLPPPPKAPQAVSEPASARPATKDENRVDVRMALERRGGTCAYGKNVPAALTVARRARPLSMPAKRHIVTALLLSTQVATASPAKPAGPPAPARDTPALIELRNEAGALSLAAVLAKLPRYRPLCDADGYPLVGNLATKGRVTQPSVICAVVRQAKSTT